jgi:O-phospho-L-seryl-tRNASec:L-selenocysteinyl-tRNA synthase
LWSWIDQKSCFKAIQSAGLECVVVPTRLEGDAVVTDLDAFQAFLLAYGDRVLAVVTTTSCFAPQVPDQVDAVARLCAEQ